MENKICFHGSNWSSGIKTAESLNVVGMTDAFSDDRVDTASNIGDDDASCAEAFRTISVAASNGVAVDVNAAI